MSPALLSKVIGFESRQRDPLRNPKWFHEKKSWIAATNKKSVLASMKNRANVQEFCAILAVHAARFKDTPLQQESSKDLFAHDLAISPRSDRVERLLALCFHAELKWLSIDASYERFSRSMIPAVGGSDP